MLNGHRARALRPPAQGSSSKTTCYKKKAANTNGGVASNVSVELLRGYSIHVFDHTWNGWNVDTVSAMLNRLDTEQR